jgi:hypothetical protein
MIQTKMSTCFGKTTATIGKENFMAIFDWNGDGKKDKYIAII